LNADVILLKDEDNGTFYSRVQKVRKELQDGSEAKRSIAGDPGGLPQFGGLSQSPNSVGLAYSLSAGVKLPHWRSCTIVARLYSPFAESWQTLIQCNTRNTGLPRFCRTNRNKDMQALGCNTCAAAGIIKIICQDLSSHVYRYVYHFTSTAYNAYTLQHPFVWPETADCGTNNSISCSVILAISQLLPLWNTSAFYIIQMSASVQESQGFYKSDCKH
jgi:hypothetical protein